MYTAAILRPLSAELLKWVMRATLGLEDEGFVLKTPQDEPLPHHMTINLGAFDPKLNDQKILGQKVTLKVDSVWYSPKIGACAARVAEAKVGDEIIQTINQHPHITICLKPPAKPVHSNLMLDDMKSIPAILDEPIELEADILEVV